MAGDELTQTDELYTATEGREAGADNTATNEAGLHVNEDGVVLRRAPRTGAAAIKRRSGNRRLVNAILCLCHLFLYYVECLQFAHEAETSLFNQWTFLQSGNIVFHATIWLPNVSLGFFTGHHSGGHQFGVGEV